MNFPKILKELRIERKLSQEQLAKHFSVNFRTISNWENGVREPDLTTLTKLAAFFDVTADYILGIDDDV